MNEIKLEKRTPEEMAAWLAGYQYAASLFLPYLDLKRRDEITLRYDSISDTLNNLLFKQKK